MMRFVSLCTVVLLFLNPLLNAKNGGDSLRVSGTLGSQKREFNQARQHNDSLAKEGQQVSDESLLVSIPYPKIINTHRPGVYFSPEVVGSGTFQVESGFGFSRRNIIPRNWTTELLIPNLELRLGILPNAEITVNTALFTSEYPNSTGNLPPMITFKTFLCQPNGLRPALALRTGVTLPGLVTTHSLDIIRPAFSMIFAGEWKPSRKNSLFLNTGVQQNGFSSQMILPFAMAYERHFSSYLSSYAEVAFTFFNPSGVTMRTDAGMYWAFSPNLQVDFSTGIDLSGGLRGWFTEAGFSAKIPQKHKKRNPRIIQESQ